MFCLNVSTICRWKETCDIECWGLTQPLCESSFFSTISGLENAWWKQTFFRSPVRVHSQASDLHCHHVQLTTQTWQVANLLHICAWIVTLRLVWLYWKSPLKWLAEEMIQLVKAPNLHQTCFAWTYYHLSMERDLWHWMLRPQTTT